ncbi:MAG: OmpH family outer membrane protein [Dysgonamonadaceae bacterium]|jgi:outer membrane protein|nr:OmpH family outer membrane protein [Dysgonamonadaceae bacterium]
MFKKIVLFAILLLPVGTFAQEKIAYFNSAEVITTMPEYTQMQDSIQKTQAAVQSELLILEEEYKKKYEAFMADADKLVETIKVRRMQEIQDIEQRAATFQEQSQKQLQQLYEQLLAPIQQKVREAIQTVGVENNFTYILDAVSLLYYSPSASDATPLVKKKLGI